MIEEKGVFMKIKNFLSLFMCLVMILTVSQSTLVSASGNQSQTAIVSNCELKSDVTPHTCMISSHKTAFSWRMVRDICLIITNVLVGALLIGVTVYFNHCDIDKDSSILNDTTILNPNDKPEGFTPDASFSSPFEN